MAVTKEQMDEWAKKSIPILKNNGYLESKIVGGSGNNWLLAIIFFVLGVAFCCIFIYAINHDAFKSEFTQNIEPNVSVENQYDFNPKTENQYDFNPTYEIYNNVIIPDDFCESVCNSGGSE